MFIWWFIGVGILSDTRTCIQTRSKKTRTKIQTEVAKYPKDIELGEIEYSNPNG